MQQTLYDFLFLGQIPGTNIFLSFYEILLLFALAGFVLWVHRYRIDWELRFMAWARVKSIETILRLRFLMFRLGLHFNH